MYDEVNAAYFGGALQLRVAWFGTPSRVARRRRLLGTYHKDKGLIRVHKLLDSPHFPDYFISFVLYHEMLHHVHPPVQKGRRRSVHHASFKQEEKRFLHYEAVIRWQKENQSLIVGAYGRAQ